jgi:hypothetical protein
MQYTKKISSCVQESQAKAGILTPPLHPFKFVEVVIVGACCCIVIGKKGLSRLPPSFLLVPPLPSFLLALCALSSRPLVLRPFLFLLPFASSPFPCRLFFAPLRRLFLVARYCSLIHANID